MNLAIHPTADAANAASADLLSSWFGGDYAPAKGVTVGLKTILAARRIMILSFGPHKAHATEAMVRGPVSPRCPASFLQNHTCVHAFVDATAASALNGTV